MGLIAAILRWSLRNRLLVVAGFVLLAIAGVRAAIQLPIDAVPDVTNIQVQIITTAPALSPVEVEQYVSVPVERSMAGIPHTTEIRSLSKYGVSVVTVAFEDGTDIYFARQMITERMREAEDAVPREYGTPEMGPISSGLGEIYQFVVRGEGKTPRELKETLDWFVAPQLRMVPGVVEVNSFGGETKQYQVALDPRRLQASGISVADVVAAIDAANGNGGGGYLERGSEQLVLGSLGSIRSLADLRKVVVGTSGDGVPVTIGRVASRVELGSALRRGAASIDGRGEVTVGVVMMLMGANSRTVTEAVKAKVAELTPSLPRGTRIEAFYDRSALVDRTIHTVVVNLAEGALLVVLVLVFLLGNVRAGVIVALVIPLAMLFALLVMNARGASGNLMSLGAIDFGLIVDGAVIVVENAVRRLAEARHREGRALTDAERVAVVEGASVEMLSASLFGQLIIAIVYIPILGLGGVEGKLFHPMATTVLWALGGAFVATITLVPVLASVLLRNPAERETLVMRALHRLYRPALGGALRRRAVTVTLGLGVLVAGVVAARGVGAEFVPKLDEGDILVEARRLPGVALSESIATDARLQKAILEVPEIAHVVSKTGAPDLANDPMGIEQTDIYIQLHPPSTWGAGRTKASVADAVALALATNVPELSIGMSQPIEMRTNELVAGVKSDIAIELYGPDLDQLQAVAHRIAGVVGKVPGAVDVRAEQGQGLTYLRIVPDRDALAQHGLTVRDVNDLTQAMAVGHEAGVVREGDRRFDIVVKLDGIDGDLDRVRALPLRSNRGAVVPLGDVARVETVTGPLVVNRNKLSRRITVEANVRGRDLVSVVDDARRAVERGVVLPAGYRVEWGGQFENFVSARARLLLVIPLALGAILFLLWRAFERGKPALLIFLNIPFAIVGGVVALAIRGLPFSISAGVGFIALFGVAVLNGLVLVSSSRRLEDDGRTAHEAIAKAAEQRLRPVLMTALVAALGFVPMALSTAPGSEVQRPLATVVIGGLVSATLLTLLLFPAVYSLAHRRHKVPRILEPPHPD
ncbi:MAG: CusA/CzcA family heavy metal efflux RND transporter [Proteobacteria bacterium]|nr:CusA/CzcA family heavy metal efflux RND transporter [Pseudomonadota bacterium]